MSDVWLIVIICIFAVAVLFACVMLMAYFGHPDDTNQAWFPRIVVITGLWISLSSVLVLPYDVSVHRDNLSLSSGIRTDILWQIIYFLVAGYCVLLIPYAYFFYENDIDPAEAKGCHQQWLLAAKYTFGFFAVFSLVLGITYNYLSVAELIVRRIALSPRVIVGMDGPFRTDPLCNPNAGCLTTDFLLLIDITFPVYLLAFLSFIGWWFFMLFTGVGFVALPLDLINEWRTRPVRMTSEEYFNHRRELGQRAMILVDGGNILLSQWDNPKNSRKQTRSNQSTYTQFEQAYYFLKKDYELLQISYHLKGGNPLWYWMKLVMGCIGFCISALWVIHVIIFVLPTRPLHPFLNQFFLELEIPDFPVFGIIAFCIFSFWLIWCCIKGAFKLGLRFLFFRIYPMELHNTMMNAFLANTWIIMLCSVPVVQFCVQSFPVYARFTSVDFLFGTQAQHIRFFRYFWENHVFIWIMILVSGITLAYLIYRPHDKEKEIEMKIAEVARGDND